MVVKTVVMHDGKVLVLKRQRTDEISPGEWDLPGGRLEQAEDPTAGAVREGAEEAGLLITDIEPLHVLVQGAGEELMIIFHTTVEHNAVTLSGEHNDYRWISPTEFAELETPQKYKDAVAKLQVSIKA